MLMKNFDFEARVVKLESQKNKAIDRCTTVESKTYVYNQYYRDLQMLTNISRIVDWAISRKCEVVFDSKRAQSGLKEGNTIIINSRISVQKQFYYILHEAGHVLVEKPLVAYNERYTYGYVAESDPNESKTTRHRVDVVAEEVEAWHRGKKLAIRLGIDIDRDEYERHRCDAILTYFKWVLRSGGYGRNRVTKTEKTKNI